MLVSREITAALRERDADDRYLDFHGASATTSYRWQEFWSLAAAYRELMDRELPGAGFVLIIGRNTPAAVACFFAGMASGRTMSFFPPSHSRQEEAHYRRQQNASLAKIGPDGIIVLDGAAPGLGTAGEYRVVQFPPFTDIAAAVQPWTMCLQAFIGRLEEPANPARPLFIQHSSGTTGIKKAVAISAAQLGAQLHSYWHGVVERGLAPDPVIASWLPLYHDMGLVATLLLPTLAGRRIGFIDAFDWVARPQLFLDLIATRGSNICWMPNFAFRHYCRMFPALRAVDLAGVRAWIDCSEPCRTRDAAAFEACFAGWGVRPASVVGCYAMAETVFAVSQAYPGVRRTLLARPDLQPGDPVTSDALFNGAQPDAVLENPRAILSSGPLVPGARVRCFVDGNPAPAGTYGEIGVAAPFRFDGYRTMTATESGIRHDGFFMTGDLGVILGNELFVFGRTKEIIIVNGKNLFLGDIEAALGGLAGIKPGRLVAFGVDSLVTGSEELVIVAERDPSVARPTLDLVSEISLIVTAQFMISLKDVMLTDERWMVKSTSGKVSRRDNRAKYLATLKA